VQPLRRAGRRRHITTIEASPRTRSSSIQQGFWEKHGPPVWLLHAGMIMTAYQMLEAAIRARVRSRSGHQLEGTSAGARVIKHRQGDPVAAEHMPAEEVEERPWLPPRRRLFGKR